MEIEQECQETLYKLEQETQKLVVTSVAMYFAESDMYHIFQIIKKYLIHNLEKTEKIWEKRIIFDLLTIDKVIASRHQCNIREELKKNTEARRVIDKYLLWDALANTKKGLPLSVFEKGFNQVTWKELLSLAEKEFGSWYSASRSDSAINEKKWEAERRINYDRVSELFESCIDVFFKHVTDILRAFDHTPLFITFCQNQGSEDVENTKKDKILQKAVASFDSLFRSKSGADQFDDMEKTGRVKLIRRVNIPIRDKNYTISYDKRVTQSAKCSIVFQQLALSKSEQQRVSSNDETVNVRQLDFHQRASLEVEASDEIQAV